ncbi:cell wall protein DAN4-like [Rana temporaria]|uniref:cell wall protein DAN4-like n=1 Tax=Rana temporaria TaxID=8407 RepID=UPI001AADEABB|nr:cell wall protein DAN4-like [Rana temporaria]
MDKMMMNCLLGLVCLTFCLHFTQAQTLSSYARTCGDCNTTSRATCEQSQGVAICTCKSGYVGDGLNCTAMVFCDTAKCCPKGYTWDVKKKQCADINECNDDTLNQCSPTDICYNRNGIYLCAANRNAACGKSGKCSDDMDCLEVNGDAQCADPCYNYKTINGTGRLYNLASPGRFETDRNYFGWFRYVGKGVSLREGCVGALKCGSMQPFTLAGKHPSFGDGIVMEPLLSNSISLGCVPGPSIPVKACSGGYWVYKYSGSLRFDVYCTDTVALAPAITTTPTTTTTTPTTTTTTTPTTTPTTTTTTTTIPTTTPTTTTPTTTPTTTTTTPTTTTPTTTTPTTTPTTTTPTTTPTTTTPTTTPTTTTPTTTPTTTTPTTTPTTTTPTTTTPTTTTPTTTPTTTTPTTTPTTTTPTTTTPTTTPTTTTPTTTTPTTTPTTTTPTTTPTTTTPTTTPTTTTPTTTTTTTTDAMEGSGSDGFIGDSIPRPRVRRALYTRLPTTTTATTTSTTTSTPSTTLSTPARELLEVLGHLKALADSMSKTLSESDRKWINNKVSQITQQINEQDPATINAALNNFSICVSTLGNHEKDKQSIMS